MNDLKLARTLVGLGVGSFGLCITNRELVYDTSRFCVPSGTYSVPAHKFVRDGRTALAAMVMLVQDDSVDLRAISLSWYPTLQCFAGQAAGCANPTYGTYNERTSDDPARALCEAAVSAVVNLT